MRTTLFMFLFFIVFSRPVFADDVICDPTQGKPALVVIDMQPVFVTRGGNHKDPANMKKVDQIIAAQKEAIEKAKQNKIPIIFIEYQGRYGDTSETLKSLVKNYDNAKFFKKTSDGMFAVNNDFKGDLINHLKKNTVGTLIVTGANGGACVQESISGSLEGNCNVLAYSKGIADFNYEQFIYPYANFYSEIKPDCKNCVFREISSFDAVADIMAGGSIKGLPDKYPDQKSVRNSEDPGSKNKPATNNSNTKPSVQDSKGNSANQGSAENR